MLRVAALLLLAACSYVDAVADSDGQVYDCGAGVEFCYYADSSAELSDLTGRSCSQSSVWDGDRLWPSLTNLVHRGCIYSCEPHTGCNAHNGCACFGGEP